jgi:hypothetical protein
MTENMATTLDRYLDEVSAHLSLRTDRKDVILELRSSILDQAEDLGEGEASEDSIAEALRRMGEPVEVAMAYTGRKYLIGPRMYRPFVIYTGLLFAVHLAMLLVATVTKSTMHLFPVTIGQIDARSLLGFLIYAVQALLMDIGIMVVIFAAAGRARRTVRMPKLTFRVQSGVRPALSRACLILLALVLLNPLRDSFFIVMTKEKTYPLFTMHFVNLLPWLNVFLALIFLLEIAYAFLGERRVLVGLDGALAAAGVALMVWFLASPAFIAVPSLVNEAAGAITTLNQLMNKVVQLILIAFTGVFAMESFKRFVRLGQMWR